MQSIIKIKIKIRKGRTWKVEIREGKRKGHKVSFKPRRVKIGWKI